MIYHLPYLSYYYTVFITYIYIHYINTFFSFLLSSFTFFFSLLSFLLYFLFLSSFLLYFLFLFTLLFTLLSFFFILFLLFFLFILLLYSFSLLRFLCINLLIHLCLFDRSEQLDFCVFSVETVASNILFFYHFIGSSFFFFSIHSFILKPFIYPSIRECYAAKYIRLIDCLI